MLTHFFEHSMSEELLKQIETGAVKPIQFNMRKPLDPVTGEERDQTGDAAKNMKYAATLQLPEVIRLPHLRMGRAVIVGGAPSIKDHLEDIKKLASDPDNAVFALNFSHNWLIDNGVVPYGCVLFEIDAEPDEFFAAAHPDVTYFICSHCHQKSFDQLANARRILWHCTPNSVAETAVSEELFPGATQIGGGIGTFLRTLSIALALGFRNIDLFGCDSSFPEDSPSTHVEGYKTSNNVETDAFYVTAKHDRPGATPRKFKTVGYLALQVEEFKLFCQHNHYHFALRVHGNSLLRFVHEQIYPEQYTPPRFGSRRI